ncbi:pirin family protein [Cecembia lonarensis]|uniref:Pirin n=1 Tax=Cecembia lonarensis (strain CCUG 58316 / KCTC 22772 / LW9) TaxID=1225176 RepID=K1L8F6_CECL9|nr:pirin family protein [Cecembia lonarensis]EKB48447.1 Pirin [Cecembia lonarensis LW9]
MSNISLIIEERATNIGNFMVGRLLPFRQKRSVGPFVFIDHMGPVKMSARENMEVLPHPHIGLSTLTFLFEGAIMHRDSIGSEIEIKPGAVNWMTAGKGVVHSERSPEYLRYTDKSLHGLQIWVALPKALEETEPSFTHIPAEEIPIWEEDGVQYKLIAGEALGKKSPVPVYSSLYFIEIKSKEAKHLSIGDKLYGESALYILDGSISSEGNEYEPKHILIAKDAKLCEFGIKANTTVYIFGGEVFPEERYIDWNFVSSSKERLAKAKADWIAQKFPKVSGETEFVPYPNWKK